MSFAKTCGILLLDKPQGLTSQAAVQRVRHAFGRIKAGHTGSLDPLATGVLPVCLGEATKVAGYLLDGDKEYEFTARFGGRTSTGQWSKRLLFPMICGSSSLRSSLISPGPCSRFHLCIRR